MFRHSRHLERASSAVIAISLQVLAIDTSRLQSLDRGAWAAMYGTAGLWYAMRALTVHPPTWLRAISLSSLICVSVLRAGSLFLVDGRLAPAALSTIIITLALREQRTWYFNEVIRATVIAETKGRNE